MKDKSKEESQPQIIEFLEDEVHLTPHPSNPDILLDIAKGRAFYVLVSEKSRLTGFEGRSVHLVELKPATIPVYSQGD